MPTNRIAVTDKPYPKICFQDTLRLILAYQSALGVNRNLVRSNKIKLRAWCRYIYSCIIICLIVTSQIMSWIVDDYVPITMKVHDVIVSVYISYLLLLNVSWARNYTQELMIGFEEIDNLFESTHVRNLLKNDIYKNNVLVGIQFSYHVILFIIVYYATSFDLSLIQFGLNFYYCVIYDLELFLFYVLLRSIGKRIESVDVSIIIHIERTKNCSLDNLFGSPQHTRKLSKSNKKLPNFPLKGKSFFHICEFMLKFTELCKKLNRTFELQIFLSLLILFFVVINNFIIFLQCLKNNTLGNGMIVAQVFWVMQYIVSVVAVCINCEKVFLQVNDTKSRLSSMFADDRISGQVRKKLKVLLDMLKSGQAGRFGAFHLVELRLRLLPEFFALTAPFVILIIQYDNLR